jgi:hypothetical protein
MTAFSTTSFHFLISVAIKSAKSLGDVLFRRRTERGEAFACRRVSKNLSGRGIDSCDLDLYRYIGPVATMVRCPLVTKTDVAAAIPMAKRPALN